MTFSSADAQQSADLRTTQLAGAYGKLPMSFEPNLGQTDAGVNFLARGNGYMLLLAPTGATLSLSGPKKTSSSQMTIELVRGNPAAQVEGLEALPGKSNYLIGNDRAKWRTNVANYAKVRYRDVYPGVDMIYYGNQRQLEYDLVVAPRADPGIIQIAFTGSRGMRIGPEGDLLLRVPDGEVRQHKPVVYQESDGTRQAVEGQYVRTGNRSVGFKLGKYDASRPLVIDPRLNYSTFLGGPSIGGAQDQALAIAVDSSGNAYVTGWTVATDFPVSKGAIQPIKGPGQNAFVTKLNSAGTGLVYSTYLGGSNSSDVGRGIAVDSSGKACVVGRTSSANFPVTPTAFQTALQAGGGVFVTQLNAAGDGLLYSTYLGDTVTTLGTAIALDSAGNAYVTGYTQSANFPVTLGAFRTSFSGISGFVSKFNPAASGRASLVYSTFLPVTIFASGIAVDSSGNAYVTGYANTSGIATPGAFQTSPGGGDDVVVTKLNAAGSALVYSTYLGGSGADRGNGIAVDGFGNAYVTGTTTSTDFPITPGAFQISFQGGLNNVAVFVTKLNAPGNGLIYSTYLVGNGVANNSNNEQGNGIAVDYAGNAYVTGSTTSISFPTTPDGFRSSVVGTLKAFAAKLSVAGDGLVYSTYLAGSNQDIGFAVAVDALGNAYVAGYSASADFPVTPAAFQTKGTPCCTGRVFVTAIAAETGVALTQTGFTFQAVQGGG
ncbi:MAG: SBBP repeat-containing protein [Acidobacteriota bacterium]|nr:SBBP repeat-containing protein [Acidobacteriota bacterium]